ncbi:hypothetical protein D3C86_1246600 [compost metagenome]
MPSPLTQKGFFMRIRPALTALVLAFAFAAPGALASPAVTSKPPVQAIGQSEAEIKAGFRAVQAAMDRDDQQEAMRLAKACLAAVRASGQHALLPEALLMSGETMMGAENDREARKYLLNGLGLAQLYGDRRSHANALNDLGIMAERDGKIRLAANYYREALPIAETVDDPQLLDAVTYDLGSAECVLEQFETGYARLTTALERTLARGETHTAVKIKLRVADVERDMKQPAQAENTALEALTMARSVKNKASEQGALRLLGMLAVDRKDLKVGEARFKEALKVARSGTDPWAQGAASLDLATFLVANQRGKEATEHLLAAQRTFKQLKRQDLVDQIRTLLNHVEKGKSKRI